VNRKSFKPHALAAALIVAMAPMGAAVAADGARIVNKAAVESGAEFSGFIVKFRDGTAQRANAAMVARSLQGANAGMAKSSRGAAGLRHFRRMSLGADVIRASRALTSAEAVQAMQQLAAMPGVEYVEPDLIMRPALTSSRSSTPAAPPTATSMRTRSPVTTSSPTRRPATTATAAMPTSSTPVTGPRASAAPPATPAGTAPTWPAPSPP